MEFKIQQKPAANNRLFIIDDTKKITSVPDFTMQEAGYAKAAFATEQSLITINRYNHFIFVYLLKNKKTDWQTGEACRKAGAEVQAVCNKLKLTDITITNASAHAAAATLMAEGIALANYQFLKYRTEAKKIANTLHTVYFTKESATLQDVNNLSVITGAIYSARTLVNEPLNFLSAVQLSKEITTWAASSHLPSP